MTNHNTPEGVNAALDQVSGTLQERLVEAVVAHDPTQGATVEEIQSRVTATQDALNEHYAQVAQVEAARTRLNDEIARICAESMEQVNILSVPRNDNDDVVEDVSLAAVMTDENESPAETDEPMKVATPEEIESLTKTDEPMKVATPEEIESLTKTDEPMEVATPEEIESLTKTDEPMKVATPEEIESLTKTDEPMEVATPEENESETTDVAPNRKDRRKSASQKRKTAKPPKSNPDPLVAGIDQQALSSLMGVSTESTETTAVGELSLEEMEDKILGRASEDTDKDEFHEGDESYFHRRDEGYDSESGDGEVQDLVQSFDRGLPLDEYERTEEAYGGSFDSDDS